MSIDDQLHIAISAGENVEFQRCVTQGARLNKYNQDGQSPLYTAIVNKQTAFAKYLVRNGSKVNCICQNSGSSALIAASARGNLPLVQFLLKVPGCDVNSIDKTNSTALDAAIDARHMDVVKELIFCRALSTSMPRHYESLVREDNIEMQELFFALDKCTLYSPDKQAELLYLASGGKNDDIFRMVQRWLRSSEYKVICHDERILHAAAGTGQRDRVRKLIGRGFCVSKETMRILMDNSLCLDIVFSSLTTDRQLMIGALMPMSVFNLFKNEFSDEHSLILLRGSIQGNNIPQYTHLVEFGNEYRVNFLRDHIQQFCLSGNAEFKLGPVLVEDCTNPLYVLRTCPEVEPYVIPKHLSKQGIYSVHEHLDTELHAGSCAIWAVQSGNIEMLRFVLELGMSVDSPLNYHSALYEAVYRNDLEMVQECIKWACYVNKTCTYSGYTALHLACELNFVGIAQELLLHGAHVNRVTYYRGFTPLHLACKFGGIDQFELLVRNGANLSSYIGGYSDLPQGVIFECYHHNRQQFEYIHAKYEGRYPVEWGVDFFALGCVERNKGFVLLANRLTARRVFKYMDVAALSADREFFDWVYTLNMSSKSRKKAGTLKRIQEKWVDSLRHCNMNWVSNGVTACDMVCSVSQSRKIVAEAHRVCDFVSSASANMATMFAVWNNVPVSVMVEGTDINPSDSDWHDSLVPWERMVQRIHGHRHSPSPHPGPTVLDIKKMLSTTELAVFSKVVSGIRDRDLYGHPDVVVPLLDLIQRSQPKGPNNWPSTVQDHHLSAAELNATLPDVPRLLDYDNSVCMLQLLVQHVRNNRAPFCIADSLMLQIPDAALAEATSVYYRRFNQTHGIWQLAVDHLGLTHQLAADLFLGELQLHDTLNSESPYISENVYGAIHHAIDQNSGIDPFKSNCFHINMYGMDK